MAMHERLVAIAIRLYPESFRERFGSEMLTVFHDQCIVRRRSASRPRLAIARLTITTLTNLLYNLPATHLDANKRMTSMAGQPQRPASMRHLVTDVRLVLRNLVKQPGFAIVAVLTLALGIGANTAVFSVLNSVVLAPLPYENPGDLVRLYSAWDETPDDRQYLAGLDILDVRDELDAFSSVGIMYTYREMGRDLTMDGATRRIRVLRVNAEYFSTYGATPLHGRTFTRDEERSDVQRTVLSHQLWSALTGQNPDAVGQTIELDGEAFEIIGVMRPTFTDVSVGDVAAWIPQDLERGGNNSRGNNYLSAVARLAPGTSIQQARAQVDILMDRIRLEFPESSGSRRLRVLPLHEDVVGESSAAVYVLMGAAGLVLLIACLNVANLFLARSVTRTRETAIRTALGAARSRVMGERLTESLVVAAAGGLAGSLVAYWGVKLLLAISPDSLARAEEVNFDPLLLGFAVIVTGVTGLLFGAAPAYRAARVDPTESLRDGSRGNSGGRGGRQARNFLVATQVSVALVLLVGAGVLIKSFMALQQVELGFDARNLTTFQINLPNARYPDAEDRVRFHHQLQDQLVAIPGVSNVSATSWLPADGPYHHWGFSTLDDAGQPQWTGAMIRVIDGDYFETFGVPVTTGRAFTRDDTQQSQGVGVISQSLATQVFGDRDPIGEVFRMGGAEFSVAGIVPEIAFEPDGETMEMVYISHGQFADDRNWPMTYVLKSANDPATVIEQAIRQLAAVDNALVLHQPRSMDAVLARHRAREQFTLLLMVVFASVALTLAGVGVYGVLSYTISQRTHEIGVRMALGAQPSQVLGIVMRHGVLVAGGGMLMGLAGAYFLGRFLNSLLFLGVSARDPMVFAAVAAVLGVVVLAAGYVPARRATSVNPLDALRKD